MYAGHSTCAICVLCAGYVWTIEHALLTKEHVLWFMEHVLWIIEHVLWTIEHVLWTIGHALLSILHQPCKQMCALVEMSNFRNLEWKPSALLVS